MTDRTIKFNGREYPIVPLDEFTIDEAILLYDYSKMGPDEVMEMEGFHPGVVGALINVAVARVQPETPQKEIRAAIGVTKLSDLEEIFAGISEEAVDETVPPPNGPSEPTELDETERSSGADSSRTGGTYPDAIGANGSGMPGLVPAATSVRVTSVN